MPSVTGHGRGSFHVRMIVDVPKKLDKEQKRLVEQLGRTMEVGTLEPSTADGDRDRTFVDKMKDLFG
jgi:DnaJ-class molecular chaperone